MSVPLIRCPFCGASAWILRVDMFDVDTQMYVSCVSKSCAARTKPADTVELAAQLWNRRV